MTSINDGVKTLTLEYDQFDMLEKVSEDGIVKIENEYDYRGRKLSYQKGSEITRYYYSGGTSIAQETGNKMTLFYRGPDQGGGVGGINYAEYKDGTGLNFKYYDLRGDVILTLDGSNIVKSRSVYTAFGAYEDTGSIETDSHRANTKVEDEYGLLNEGKRFRSLEYGVFLTPDPLEYVDGLNPYIYCGQNPWGRWDPEGLNSVVLTWNYSSLPGLKSVGHSGIAIPNYVEKTYEYQNVTLTTMVHDGSYTYYDKWPSKAIASEHDIRNGVEARYNDGVKINSMKELMAFSGETGKKADGIVRIDTNYAEDMKMKEHLEAEVASKKKYNVVNSQCSTFVEEAVKTKYKDFDAGQKIENSRILRQAGLRDLAGKKTATPNKLYNELKKLEGASVLRGPSKKEETQVTEIIKKTSK